MKLMICFQIFYFGQEPYALFQQQRALRKKLRATSKFNNINTKFYINILYTVLINT